MSRMIVLKPQASKKISHLLKNALCKEVEVQKEQSYFEFVLRKLYKTYQQQMQSLYYEFLSQVEKWNIQWFNKSFEWRSKNFLVKVCHISFPNLKTLTIANLEINNIEALEWMDFPNLQTLNLSHNTIITLKPLSKTSHPKLQSIYLENNPISYNELDRWQNRASLNQSRILNLEIGTKLEVSSNGLLMKLNTKKFEKYSYLLELLPEKTFSILKEKFKPSTQS